MNNTIENSLNDLVVRSFKTVYEMINDRKIDTSYIDNITYNELNEFIKNNENYIEIKVKDNFLILYYLQKIDSKNIDIINKIILNFYNNNKTDNNKTDNNKTDNNKTDNNKTDNNKTDNNKTDNNKTDNNIILITKDKIKTNNLKNILNYNLNKNIELFTIKELLFNPYRHELVPKHEPITDKKVINNLIKLYKLKNIHQFPLLLSKDPICKYLNIPKNSLVKITRPSQTAGEYIMYRCVV
jgi:DNA-directed RNA polymerase subunit H (RpoH/RPB5)